jgi:LysR family hydrogen peroxide-inducible transcriptional activator
VPEDGLEVEVLFKEPFVVALPEHHALAARENIGLGDLVGTELLLLEEGHCLRDHALEVCALAGAHERVDFHATSMETLRQMVAADVGITLMPLLSVKPPIAKTENLAIRPFTGQAPSRTIALVWRSSSALGPFLRELSQVFKEMPDSLLELNET